MDGSGIRPSGRTIAVAGGTIHEWRGSVVVAGITVEQLVAALETPGLPPPCEDVLAARLLGRRGDTLQIYLRLTRTAILSVTYDTVHDVTFTKPSGGVAASRSVATFIREAGGSDHGFLWRLNSYWRYEQRGRDVVVTVLSLSLSRQVPSVAKAIASPIIEAIGRESVERTLEAVERFGRRLA